MKFHIFNKTFYGIPGLGMHFTNNKGELLSAVRHQYAFCDENTFEVWDRSNESEPIGHVTYKKLTTMLNQHMDK